MLKRHILAFLTVLAVLGSLFPASALILRSDVSPKPRLGDFRSDTSQGREWDAHRQDYYFRNRIYVPEWGCFTGSDMNLSNGIEGEPNGVGNYLFCRNDPVNNTDPLGLIAWDWLTTGKWTPFKEEFPAAVAVGGMIAQRFEEDSESLKG